MRRHVVGSFVVMFVTVAFRRDPRKISLEVTPCCGSGILLDDKRCRRVAAEKGQEAVADTSRPKPGGDLGREILKARATRAD